MPDNVLFEGGAGETVRKNLFERWKSFTYDELVARGKTNLDIFWLKDDSLEDTENLPAPEVLAAETVEQLEVALEEFRSVEDLLKADPADQKGQSDQKAQSGLI